MRSIWNINRLSFSTGEIKVGFIVENVAPKPGPGEDDADMSVSGIPRIPKPYDREMSRFHRFLPSVAHLCLKDCYYLWFVPYDFGS